MENTKEKNKKMDARVMSAIISGAAGVVKEGVGVIGRVFTRPEKETTTNITLTHTITSDSIFKVSQITDEDVNFVKEYKNAPMSEKIFEAQYQGIIQNPNLSAEEKNVQLDELNRKYVEQRERAENRASEECHRKHKNGRITGVLLAVAVGVSTTIPIVAKKVLNIK